MSLRASASGARPARPAAAAGAPAGWAELPFLVALLAHVAVVLALRHFPFQDLPNHVARFALIARALGGAAPPWLDVRLIPTAYVGGDLVGAALVAGLGPAAAATLYALAAALALPLGTWRLLGAVAPAQRGWAVAAVLLTFSSYYLSSFLNYVLGVGAAFAWLAAWWPRRGRAGARARAGLALGLVGLFLVHLAAPLIALVVVGAELGWVALRVWRGPLPRRRAAAVARLAPRLVTLAACVAALAVVWGGSTLLVGQAPPIRRPFPVPRPPAVVFRTPGRKVLALAYPFYTLSRAQGVGLALAYGVALALFVRQQGRAALRHPLAAGAAALLALYVVWPLSVGQARAVDVRWLLPAYALAFCAVTRRARPPSVPALALVAALAVAHAAVVYAAGRRIDRDLAAFDRVLARLPAGTRVLPLVTPTRRHPDRVTPYLHHAQWFAARGRGRVAGLFAADGLVDDGYGYEHLAHVRERDRMYFYDGVWGRDSTPPLPWTRIWQDADVVVHAGDDSPRLRAELAAHGRVLDREGDVTVYGPPGAAPPMGVPATATPARP